MKQAVLHQNLARIFTHASLGAPVQRAYALWASLRPEGPAWYFYDDVVAMYAEKSGKHPDTVRNWIKTGIDMGLFIKGKSHDGRSTLSLVGKDNVFTHHLGGIAPGKAILINADVLLSANLQELRSLLFHTFVVEKPVIRSRAFLASTIDRVELTTRNYSRAIGQPKRYTYLKQSGGYNDQRPNAWQPHPLFTTRTHHPGVRHSYKPSVKCPKARKMYYYNYGAALKAATDRSKAGENPVTFRILPDAETKRSAGAKRYGHIFMEPVVGEL